MSDLDISPTDSRPITSDFHLEENLITTSTSNSITKKISRIEFRLPLENNHSKILIDQEGDLITERHEKHYLLLIEHEIQTKLEDVGFQLWRSNFFLGDYLLNNLNLIEDKILIELGAGLGVLSYILSFYARIIFCTDLEKIVQKAEENWLANQMNLKEKIEEKGSRILFKNLDWTEYENIFEKLSIKGSKFDLNNDDVEMLRRVDVILAADVIYDQTITLNFFNTIFKLMTKGNKQVKLCLIANEKRINFDIDSLSVTDVAFNLFEKCMSDLDEYEDGEAGFIFEAKKIKIDSLDNYFLNYKRTKYLEIWSIKATPK
ncbi:unnamed protein product [Brachionus calyciflorus]|uniref:Methyltransferase 22 n=1 Tax=Brachionus calyciflorus TaxID=104777 RepID=A0A814G518_9BILA|nr:unnamed protein product [Brachionus calyciflorus]